MPGVSRAFVYTTTGPQRPVFLTAEGPIAFDLEMGDGCEGYVEITHDAQAVLRRGKGAWVTYEGGLAGGVYGVVALRAVLPRNPGWARLTLAAKGGAADPCAPDVMCSNERI